MLITAIAAMDENHLLAGKDGILWKLPRDSRHFRQTTNGHHLLLGRTTYEEMIGWFDRHLPLVLTSDPDYRLKPDPQGRTPGSVVHSSAEAIERARQAGETEFFIGGGGKVYAECLPLCDRLLITRVEHAFPQPLGAVYFPPFSTDNWTLIHEQVFPPEPESPYSLRFQDWRFTK